MGRQDIPVFILCGGLGTRLKEQTEFRPKPMVPLGKHPIIWHIMNTYSYHGFNRFVLCMGYRSEVIREYFLRFYEMNADMTVNLSTNNVVVHSVDHSCGWEVTLAYTGELTMTGGRVARAAARYLGDAEHFAVTYGDGLTDVDLAEEFAFHKQHGKIGTVLGVNPPSRFGEFQMDGERLVSFIEKPEIRSAWINGGYFFFHRDFLRYLSPAEDCVLEQAPLSRLAADGQLQVCRHSGYWACMDTQRDHEELTRLWNSGKAPWARPPRPAVADNLSRVQEKASIS
jgi:glucose-1-phosphate cytidylyltransferase